MEQSRSYKCTRFPALSPAQHQLNSSHAANGSHQSWEVKPLQHTAKRGFIAAALPCRILPMGVTLVVCFNFENESEQFHAKYFSRVFSGFNKTSYQHPCCNWLALNRPYKCTVKARQPQTSADQGILSKNAWRAFTRLYKSKVKTTLSMPAFRRCSTDAWLRMTETQLPRGKNSNLFAVYCEAEEWVPNTMTQVLKPVTLAHALGSTKFHTITRKLHAQFLEVACQVNQVKLEYLQQLKRND